MIKKFLILAFALLCTPNKTICGKAHLGSELNKRSQLKPKLTKISKLKNFFKKYWGRIAVATGVGVWGIIALIRTTKKVSASMMRDEIIPEFIAKCQAQNVSLEDIERYYKEANDKINVFSYIPKNKCSLYRELLNCLNDYLVQTYPLQKLLSQDCSNIIKKASSQILAIEAQITKENQLITKKEELNVIYEKAKHEIRNSLNISECARNAGCEFLDIDKNILFRRILLTLRMKK